MGVYIIFIKTIVTLFKKLRKYFVPQWVFSNDFATLCSISFICCCVRNHSPPNLVASNRSHLLFHHESVDLLGGPAHLNRFSWSWLGLLMFLQWVGGSAGGWSQLGWPSSLHCHRLSQACSQGRGKGLQEAVKVQSFLKLILKTVTSTEFF